MIFVSIPVLDPHLRLLARSDDLHCKADDEKAGLRSEEKRR